MLYIAYFYTQLYELNFMIIMRALNHQTNQFACLSVRLQKVRTSMSKHVISQEDLDLLQRTFTDALAHHENRNLIQGGECAPQRSFVSCGPWHIEQSYADHGGNVSFTFYHFQPSKTKLGRFLGLGQVTHYQLPSWLMIEQCRINQERVSDQYLLAAQSNTINCD